jgi:hypothetical protein
MTMKAACQKKPMPVIIFIGFFCATAAVDPCCSGFGTTKPPAECKFIFNSEDNNNFWANTTCEKLETCLILKCTNNKDSKNFNYIQRCFTTATRNALINANQDYGTTCDDITALLISGSPSSPPRPFAALLLPLLLALVAFMPNL